MANKLEEYSKNMILAVKYSVEKAIRMKAYKFEDIEGLKDEVNWNAIMSASSTIKEVERCKWILWKTQYIISS